MARTLHTIPTHLKVADKVIVIGDVGLSARQLLLLLVGSCICYDSWLNGRWLDHWISPLGFLCHWLLILCLAVCTLALTFVQIAGRSLEQWLIIVLRYWHAPRCCVWYSSRRDEVSLHLPRSKQRGRHRTKGEEISYAK